LWKYPTRKKEWCVFIYQRILNLWLILSEKRQSDAFMSTNAEDCVLTVRYHAFTDFESVSIGPARPHIPTITSPALSVASVPISRPHFS
jgi:hypothetical protein